MKVLIVEPGYSPYEADIEMCIRDSSHKVCRTGNFLGVEPEYHRANIKCVFSSELKMRRNREENKAVPINLF